MSTASTIAAFVALGWAAVLAWLTIGALLCRVAFARRARGRPGVELTPSLAVLLVRPCAGDEPGLLDNLCSAAGLGGALSPTVVMAVDDPEDSARSVTLEARGRLAAAGLDAHCEVHRPLGPNRKASLIASVAAAHPEAQVIINADSNVDLRGVALEHLVEPLFDGSEKVGAAWVPWSERKVAPGPGPRASEAVLGGSLTAFPLLCGLVPNNLVGKLWAARCDALAQAGGLAALTNYLGEDLEMSRRLRRAGWRVAVAPTVIRAPGSTASLRQVIARVARWMLVVRAQQPALFPTYLAFFFATPFVLALAAFGFIGRPLLAAIAVGLAVGARLIVTLGAQYWSRRPIGFGRALVDAALSDLVLALAWLKAVSSREVEWRGHRLRIARDGRLTRRS